MRNNATSLVLVLFLIQTLFNLGYSNTEESVKDISVMNNFLSVETFGLSTPLVAPSTNPPIASFTVNNPNAEPGEILSFSDLSSNTITSWQWTFSGADTLTSSSQHPLNTYSLIGTYDVTLIVVGPYGSDTLTKLNYITIANDYLICNNTSSDEIIGYLFDSGGPNGVYTPNENCEFLISNPCATSITLNFNSMDINNVGDKLTIYDGADENAPVLIEITTSGAYASLVSSSGQVFFKWSSNFFSPNAGFEIKWTATLSTLIPTAAFSVSSPQFLNTPVQFTDLSSPNIDAWSWNFGNGDTSDQQNPTTIYQSSGLFNVSLVVDNCSNKDTIYQNISILGAPELNYTPDTIQLSKECGVLYSDSILIQNDGTGPLLVNLSPLGSATKYFVDSLIYSQVNASSYFTFENIPLHYDSMVLRITLNGDYDDSNENVGYNADNALTGYIYPYAFATDYTFERYLTSTSLDNIVQDGKIIVRITNPFYVDDLSGTRLHKVELVFFKYSYLTNLQYSDTIQAGESVYVPIEIDLRDQLSGIFYDSIQIHSNDIASPHVIVPIQIEILGEPEIEISHTCFDFDTIFQNESILDSFIIYNRGCDTLFITNVGFSNSGYHYYLQENWIGGYDSATFYFEINDPMIGTNQDTLYIENNDSLITICLDAEVIASPIYGSNTNAINLSLDACNDSSVIPITLYNHGANTLNIQLDRTAFTPSGGAIKILALTYAVDTVTYYPDLQDIILNSVPEALITSSSTTDPLVIESLAPNYDIILLPNSSSGLGSATVLNSWSTVLQDYQQGGGSIIMLGGANNLPFSTGLIDGGSFQYPLGSNISNVDPNHPIMNGLGNSFISSAASCYDITDPNFNTLAKRYGFPIAGYINEGPGTFVLIGNQGVISQFSPYQIMLTNSIYWSFTASASLPSWMNVNTDTLMIPSGDSATVNFTFYSNNLAGGNYTSTIVFETNDPLQPVDSIPIQLSVSMDPCAKIGIGEPIYCNGTYHFIDSSYNAPLIWQWNFGDGNTSSQQNPVHSYTNVGIYDVELVVCNLHSCDTTNKTIVVPNTSGAQPSFCAVSGSNSSVNYDITNFQINSINNPNAFDPSNLYQDFACDQQTTLTENINYNCSFLINSSMNSYIHLWIDLNNNGYFSDPGELILSYYGTANPYITSVNIPHYSTNVYNTPLRMRVSSAALDVALCATNGSIEIEDYSVTIQPNLLAPTAQFAVSQTGCTGHVDFSDLSQNWASSWQWNFGDGSSSTDQNPSHVFNANGTYPVTLIACNINGCDTVQQNIYLTNVTTVPPTCEPTGNNTSTVCDITYFGLANINHSSPVNNTSSHEDFSCSVSTSLILGTLYNISINSSSNGQRYTKIWIDLNRDGDFNDSHEEIYASIQTYPLNDLLVLPSYAPFVNVPLKMRVAISSGNYVTSCGANSSGEYEDYTVILLDNVNPPVADASYSTTDPCWGIYNFSSESSPNTTSWLWNFGDGTTSTMENPIHVYNQEGTYSVTLIASNSNGSDSYQMSVNVNIYRSSFTVSQSSSNTFDFISTTSGAISWTWNFGDGSISTAPSPSHTYSDTICYDVNLITSNGVCQNTTPDYELCVSLFSNINHFDPTVSIYPNPAEDYIILESNDEAIKNIALYNGVGQIIHHQNNLHENFLKINLQGVPSGVYFILLETERETVQSKIVVTK